jgi:tyrosyl-tRNA synthetase
VQRFHGPEGAAAAQEAFDRVHVRHELPEEITDVEVEQRDGVVHLPALLASAFAVSTSEARRALSQGGVKLDGESIAPGVLDLPGTELDGRVLQLGKRRFVRVRVR